MRKTVAWAVLVNLFMLTEKSRGGVPQVLGEIEFSSSDGSSGGICSLSFPTNVGVGKLAFPEAAIKFAGQIFEYPPACIIPRYHETIDSETPLYKNFRKEVKKAVLSVAPLDPKGRHLLDCLGPDDLKNFNDENPVFENVNTIVASYYFDSKYQGSKFSSIKPLPTAEGGKRSSAASILSSLKTVFGNEPKLDTLPFVNAYNPKNEKTFPKPNREAFLYCYRLFAIRNDVFKALQRLDFPSSDAQSGRQHLIN